MLFTRGSFLGAPINPVPSSAVGVWNNNDSLVDYLISYFIIKGYDSFRRKESHLY